MANVDGLSRALLCTHAALAFAAGLAALGPSRSTAAPVLTYDSGTISSEAGSLVDVYATLTVDAPLSTNGNGQEPGPFDLMVSVGEQSQTPLVGSPGYEFATHSTFTPDGAAVGDLSLSAGQSIHLLLGQLLLAPDIALGSYSTDIGLYVSCGPGICVRNPFMAPNFADAGPLTIQVAVDEPRSAVMFGLSLLLLVVVGTVRQTGL